MKNLIEIEDGVFDAYIIQDLNSPNVKDIGYRDYPIKVCKKSFEANEKEVTMLSPMLPEPDYE